MPNIIRRPFDPVILLGNIFTPVHWEKFRAFYRTSILKVMIAWFAIVPLSLKVLKNIPDQIYIPLSDTNIAVNLSLPFRWWLLWFASISYSLGYALYVLWCPPFSLKWPTFVDYQSAKNNKRFIVWEIYKEKNNIERMDSFLDWLISIKCAETTTEKDYYEHDKPQAVAGETTLVIRNKDRHVKISMKNESIYDFNEEEIYWSLQEHLVTTKTVKRRIVLLFGLAAFILSAIPVIESIYFVFCYLFRA